MNKTKTTKRALLSSVLALFLCFTMLLGTTYAWFTDSVSSKGNVIQTGNLKVGFQWAERVDDLADAAWTDVNGDPIFTYVNWEPGFTAVKHFKIYNNGTLALNYQMRIVANGVVSDLANVIDVYVINDASVTSNELKAATPVGTLLDVMGTENHISRKISGSLEAGSPADIYTVAFKMRESAGNEYQNMDLGCDFTVELIATQMSAENDSFGPEYDIIVPSPELPAALVTPLDNLNITYTTDFPNGTPVANPLPLNAGYQFLPTEYGKDLEDKNNPAFPNEAGMSAYKHWHADYVVTADTDIALNTIALAGYYGAFCEDYNNGHWVAMMDDSTEVLTAGTEVALLDVLGGFCVTYQDICDWGNDGKGFQCGIIARDAAALAGTTITVELRLYENLNNEWSDSSHDCDGVNYDGYYDVAGTFTYTFPAYEVEGQTELNAALDAGCTDIAVSAGTYTFPSSKLSEGTTLYCEEGTVFTGTSKLNIDGATVVGATFSNPTGTAADQTINGTFKNCTFTGSNGLRWAYAGETVVFENCVFDGSVYGVHFDGGATEVIFKNCTISGFNATAGAIEKVTFDGCTFVANGKGSYNGVNSWGSTDYINCTFVFDGSVPYEWVDLCGADEVMTFTNCVVEGAGQLTDYVSKREASSKIYIDGVEFVPNP